MKIALRAGLLVVWLALGFWAWTIFFPSPAQAVRRQINKVARLASSPASEGRIGRGLDVERLSLLFSQDVHVTVTIPDRGTFEFEGRDELTRRLLALKGMTPGLKAEFLDARIEMGTGNLSALADLTLKATLDGQTDTIFQEMKFTLKQVKGDWQITSVETVSPLKP